MSARPAYAAHAPEMPLIGHEVAEQRLLADWNAARLPHAYLLSGRRGIGKATLAERFARFILNQDQPQAESTGLFADLPASTPQRLESHASSSVSLRMQAGTHTGFMLLRPAYDEKKERYKDEITINQVREITAFLSLTAGEGAHKVIMIDPAEAMNPNAANALLKWLEEPPNNTLFLLVSHAPSRLLPTIRSRCRKLPLSPLSAMQCAEILALHGVEAPQQDALLFALAEGSAGMLIELAAADAAAVFDSLLRLVAARDVATLEAYRFAESVASSKTLSWENWSLLTQGLLALIIKAASGLPLGECLSVEQETLLRQLSSALDVSLWLRRREEVLRLHQDTQLLYLDRKHVVMMTLTALAGGKFSYES